MRTGETKCIYITYKIKIDKVPVQTSDQQSSDGTNGTNVKQYTHRTSTKRRTKENKLFDIKILKKVISFYRLV